MNISGSTTIPDSISNGVSHLHIVAESGSETDPFPGNNRATVRIDISTN